MRGEQNIGQRPAKFGEDGFEGDVFKDFADQGVAVRVRARGTESYHDVASLYGGARQNFFALHQADNGSGDVKFMGGIDARHLGCFTAQQGTAGGATGGGHTLHDLRHHFRDQSRTGHVIQKK